jgi:hypothetical protein
MALEAADRCHSTNMSIGYWQVSYVYASVDPDLALKYAVRCKDLSEKLEPFYLGRSLLNLAAAEKVSGIRNDGRICSQSLQILNT